MGAKPQAFVLAMSALALTLLAATAARAADAGDLDNATCLACHGAPDMTLPLAGGETRSLFAPADQFAGSIHATLPCVACHATITKAPHDNPPATVADWNRARLAVNRNCGDCHPQALRSYAETYHGQVAALGYADVATCSDCHGAHSIRYVGDPASGLSPAGQLATCKKCHSDATPGFATFEAHAVTDDFARYPVMWIASKFVNLAVGGVLVVFWIHSALWFYREFRDRQQRRPRPHVRTEARPTGEARHYQRWSAPWRWAHLMFAVSIILLVMTGVTLLYPNAFWAPALEGALGGPRMAGLIHRAAAAVMVAVFAAHIVYAAVHIARNWKTFEVFGPYSLMPNWRDAADVAAMLKWFFGRGPRPTFDHWNYQQKVDYWAPFWGIAMLVGTGAVLWFKTLAGAVLPGWAFNVAAVAHGDEALLAAAYLFTVHYFVNHWRPDKFPLDVVIFTGSMPLEEFKREYADEYERLARTDELKRHLVEAPSRPLTLGAKVVGFSLVAVGLALLVMMANGFWGGVAAG